MKWHTFWNAIINCLKYLHLQLTAYMKTKIERNKELSLDLCHTIHFCLFCWVQKFVFKQSQFDSIVCEVLFGFWEGTIFMISQFSSFVSAFDVEFWFALCLEYFLWFLLVCLSLTDFSFETRIDAPAFTTVNSYFRNTWVC